MSERYTINDVDVTTYLTHLQVIDGNIGIPPLLQNDYVIPGRTGVVTGTPWWGPRVVTFGGVVTGRKRSDYQENLRKLMELVHQSGQTYQMRRRLDLTFTPGPGTLATPNLQTTVANVRYVGGFEQVQQLAPNVGRVAFDILLTEGYWFDTGVSTLGTVTGTRTLKADGNAPTQRVNITYSIGPESQRVTNEQFPGVGRLTLVPGNNKLTVAGGGNVVITYRAAWL